MKRFYLTRFVIRTIVCDVLLLAALWDWWNYEPSAACFYLLLAIWIDLRARTTS